MDEKILLEKFERVVGKQHVTRSVSSEEKQPGRFPTTGECRDDVESGMIYPVQVFEDQNQTSISRDDFQRFADLAHHPLARGSENLLLKGLLLISSDQ